MHWAFFLYINMLYPFQSNQRIPDIIEEYLTFLASQLVTLESSRLVPIVKGWYECIGTPFKILFIKCIAHIYFWNFLNVIYFYDLSYLKTVELLCILYYYIYFGCFNLDLRGNIELDWFLLLDRVDWIFLR